MNKLFLKIVEFIEDHPFLTKLRLRGVVGNITLGKNVKIRSGARVICTDKAARIVIGDGTIINRNAIIDSGPGGSVVVGKSNTLNPFCVIYGHGGFVSGDYVRIASHTVFIPANHKFDRLDIPIAKQGLTKVGISIGSDVWFGAGCRVLDGVTIGNHCVIGAGSVVTRNLPDKSVAIGVPAKIRKVRE